MRRGLHPVAAIRAIRPKGPWWLVGLLGIVTAFFILSYYSVAAGWTILSAGKMLFHETPKFEEIASQPYQVLVCMAIMLWLTYSIVKKGIKQGIERWSKILMPLLAILLGSLIIRSLLLPNSFEGVKYYLYPDFSEDRGRTGARERSMYPSCLVL